MKASTATAVLNTSVVAVAMAWAFVIYAFFLKLPTMEWQSFDSGVSVALAFCALGFLWCANQFRKHGELHRQTAEFIRREMMKESN